MKTTATFKRWARILAAHPLVRLLEGDVYYRQFSRQLNLLLICQALARVLKAIASDSLSSKGVLKIALVGSHRTVLENVEVLTDYGFEISYFVGRPGDIFHVSRPLAELVPSDFDCILVADRNREKQLCAEVAARGAHPIRIMHLVDSHIAALRKINRWAVVSCLSPHKLAIVATLVALSQSEGSVIECGVYMGGTTVYLALLQRELGLKRPIFALDTYEGMPEPSEGDFGGGEVIYTAGTFSETREYLVRSLFKMAGVARDIRIVAGLCQETLPVVLKKNPSVAFALLDTDQYAGTKGGLDSIGPFLAGNAAILVDDTTVHGVDRAIKEALEKDSSLVRRPLITNFDLIMRRRASPN